MIFVDTDIVSDSLIIQIYKDSGEFIGYIHRDKFRKANQNISESDIYEVYSFLAERELLHD